MAISDPHGRPQTYQNYSKSIIIGQAMANITTLARIQKSSTGAALTKLVRSYLSRRRPGNPSRDPRSDPKRAWRAPKTRLEPICLGERRPRRSWIDFWRFSQRNSSVFVDRARVDFQWFLRSFSDGISIAFSLGVVFARQKPD